MVLFVALLGNINFSEAQTEPEYRVIPSISAWLEEIANWPDSSYSVNNVRIEIDSIKDRKFLIPDLENTYGSSKDEEPYVIDKKVSMDQFSFGSGNNVFRAFGIQNLLFRKNVTFYFLENSRLELRNIVFEGKMTFRIPDTRFWLNLNNCTFNNEFIFTNPTQPTPVNIQNCTFNASVFIASDDARPTITIDSSKFEKPLLFGERSVLRSLFISNSFLNDGVSLRRVTIENSLELTDSDIGKIDISGIEVPPYNTYIPFKQVQNKLVLFNKEFSESKYFYTAASDEELADDELYDKLIASYSKLLSVYKARSEMESYNSCYIEMKDKQTARTKLVYNSQPSFSSYFDHKINLFMKTFSDYGTRPAKALVVFFQVVLAFAVFYFFFPSKWNNTDNGRVLKWFTMIGKYFTSDKNLSGIYDDENVEQYESFEEFRDFLVSSKKELPAYFQLLRKPLYALSVVRYNTTRVVLKNVDILNGRWVDLPRRKRLIASILTGVYLFLYLVYAMLIRAINAITLSLNAFSTLGFGEIPTKGLARYIVIIQGFLGWFLLSIFLVSLIGQILN